jgi:hypothetical protein
MTEIVELRPSFKDKIAERDRKAAEEIGKVINGLPAGTILNIFAGFCTAITEMMDDDVRERVALAFYNVMLPPKGAA